MKALKLILFCIPGLFCLAALIILDCYIHNFDTVVPAQIYRSRELSQQQFAEIIEKYHINSVLNLRGSHDGLKWYDQELATTKSFGVKHYDLALRSKILPTPQDFNKLVNILINSPKPLLIHCESGVDRTGLAAVIALILNGTDLKDAEKQISVYHFVLSEQSVGKQFLRIYSAWLAKNNLTTSRENFLLWVK